MDNETNNMGVDMSEPKESSTGPVIGTIIILAVIVLGGFYFWSQRADNTVMDEAMVDEVVTDITTQSQADDTASIEADLNATEVNNIDSELNVQ